MQKNKEFVPNRSKWVTQGLGILLFSFAMFFFPKLASAATIYLSPAASSIGVGSTFNVNVLINTQGEPVNTAEASISYSTSTLELVSVRQGSTFYLISPGSPSKGASTAYFAGGLPTPGYNGNGGVLGSMTFRAKVEGTATVSVDSGKVLLNDGQGTNAFNGSAGARFAITPPPVAGVVVSSITHPNSDGWYPKSNVDLTWNRPNGAFGFSFEFDQNPNTIPDSTLDTTVTTAQSYTDLKDGDWYFHIKARAQSATAGFGATTHYRVGIDTQKPLLFDIKLVGQDDPNDVTRTPTISFEGKDETSGIDHYAVSLDDEVIVANATSPYSFEKLDNGPHRIIVMSFDKAGNDRKSEIAIIVQGPPVVGFFQRNLSLPLYLILLVNLIALFLIIAIFWLVFKRRHYSESPVDEIAKLQANVDRSLEELKLDINKKLLSLSIGSSEELYKKETAMAETMTKKITKTREKIDSNLKKIKKGR